MYLTREECSQRASPSGHQILASPLLAGVCTSTQSDMFACVGTNSLACGLGCMQGQLNAINADTANCTNNNGFCAASACCPQCAATIDAYKKCLLDTSCDTTCPSIVPSPPTPNSYIPPSPSGSAPTDDDGVSLECKPQASAFKACIFANLQGCMTSCAILGERSGSENVTCQDVPDKCQEAACCPACIAQGKAFVECEAGVLGCDEDCSDVAPVAPSPSVPTPSFPPYGNATNDDEISPECVESLVAFSSCIAQYADVCVSSCANLDSDDSTSDPFSCGSAQKQCGRATCCANCASQGEAVIACETNARGCPESCSDSPTSVQPTSPPPNSSPKPASNPTSPPSSGSSAFMEFASGLVAIVVMLASDS